MMRYRLPATVAVLTVAGSIAAALFAARDEAQLQPAGPPVPPALRAAKAVFLEHQFVVRVPMGAAAWGEPVKMDEDADSAFALTVPGSSKRYGAEWVIAAKISSRQELDHKANQFFFRLFKEPEPPLGQFPSPGELALRDVLRRCVNDSTNWSVTTEGENLLIYDDGGVFNDIIKLKPKSVLFRIQLARLGRQEVTIPIEYRFDPANAKPTPMIDN